MSEGYNEILTPKNYYGLRIISMFCKSVTVISAILGIGLCGAIFARLLRETPQLTFFTMIQMWLNESIIVLIVVGGIGFMFFIVSQLLDVQIAINNKVNVIADVLKSMDKIVDKIEEDTQDSPPDTMTHSQYQEIMQTLQRQARMLSKMYQDLVDKDDSGSDDIPVKLT